MGSPLICLPWQLVSIAILLFNNLPFTLHLIITEHTKGEKKGTQTFKLLQASSGLPNFENFKFTKQAIPKKIDFKAVNRS